MLAIYEKRPNDMTGSIEMLNYWLFEKSVATALIAENDNGENIGYAIYYPIFSSFFANVKVHLEDLLNLIFDIKDMEKNSSLRLQKL